MQKLHIAGIVLLTLVLSLLANIFMGRYLSAKISTLPLLNRWNIVSPQTPIVITNREEIRVSDTGDILDAVSSIKSKLSVIVNQAGELTGSAINLTAEGVFVTAIEAFPQQGQAYFVVLGDGKVVPISKLVSDPVTKLVFVQANGASVPVASMASSKEAQTGEKVFFLTNTLQSFRPRFQGSYVTQMQNDLGGATLSSDRPLRAFSVQAVGQLLPGQAIVNVRGELLGLWNGSGIISSDVLRQTMNLYFANTEKIVRPQFGFTYQFISKVGSQVGKQPEGARVIEAEKGRTAAETLLPQDVITEVGGVRVSEENLLEELLQKYKPSDKVTFTVVRGTTSVSVTLTAQ